MAGEKYMHGQAETNGYITLTEAAKITPGRPSTNCMWRWCRRGVKSRSGERVRLEHRRMGGKIFTKLEWLDQFGRLLAEADAKYFDLCEAAAEAAAEPPPHRRRHRNPTQFQQQRRREIEEAERELAEAGIR